VSDVAPAAAAAGSGLPAWARRLYLGQGALLALAALALLWLFHATRLDLRLEAPYYDAVNHTFPWRYAWISKYLVHRYLKHALIALGLWVWAVVLYARWRRVPAFLAGRERRWWVVALSFVLVPGVSALLRHYSTMHCPWDVLDFGGYAPYFDPLQNSPAGLRPGRCFPAGFVTAGTWLLAFALLWYPERRLRSWVLGLALAAFALGLGWVQQMRGAHFLSHTLWSLWLTWLAVLGLHVACRAWRDAPE
jgi:membrane-associated PAP2 superfamily phosphatase